MRILILNHNERNHGTFFRCFFLSRHLSKSGNQLVLSCLRAKGDGSPGNVHNVDGVRLWLLPGQHGSSSLSEFPWHLYRAFLNIRLALTEHFDSIYAFNVASLTTGLPMLALRLLKALRIINAKLVVDCDDWWGRGGLTTITHQGRLVEALATIMEEKIPLAADAVTVVSAALKERTLRAGVAPGKVFYLPNGANPCTGPSVDKATLREELGLPAGAEILCFAGSVLTCFDFLLRSIHTVVRERPNAIVVIVAPLQPSHEAMVRDLDLAGNVIAVGFQPYENLIRYLRASDVLLLPRTNDKSQEANYPARLGDYMAAGRPIVATAFGEVEKVLLATNCGLLAKLDDPTDFANKVSELLRDPTLRDDLGSRGLAAASQALSWQQLAAQLTGVLSD